MLAFPPNLSTIYAEYVISLSAKRGPAGLFGAAVRISVNESGDPPRAMFLLPEIYTSDREASTHAILQGTYWVDLQRLPPEQPLQTLPWIREPDYLRIRGLLTDGLSLPARYEDLCVEMDERERSVRTASGYPMRVLVAADDLIAISARERRTGGRELLQACADEAAGIQFLWLGPRIGFLARQ